MFFFFLKWMIYFTIYYRMKDLFDKKLYYRLKKLSLESIPSNYSGIQFRSPTFPWRRGCGSVCRGCIVRRLSSGARACPVCNVAASPPLLPDTRLQRLVYLAVPGLFRSELERRRHFRLVNPQCPPLASPVGALDLTLEDLISLSLRELRADAESETKDDACDSSQKDEVSGISTRYLKCPAAVTVRHLVRLLMLKRGWEEANASVNGVNNRIEIMYQHPDDENMRPLDSSWTLLDLACIFQWERVSIMIQFERQLIDPFYRFQLLNLY